MIKHVFQILFPFSVAGKPCPVFGLVCSALTFLPFFLVVSTPHFLQAEVVVVVFGDSTSAPRGKLKIYADLLREEFHKHGIAAKVVNAAVGGNTTRAALARFETDVVAKHPDLVIIQFGINDAAVDVWKTPPALKPRVSLKEFEANIRQFIRRLKQKRAEVVLMTPNCLAWTPKLKRLYGKPPYLPDDKNGFNVLLTRYATAIRQIGKEQEVPVIDIYRAFNEYGSQKGQQIEDLLLDGMHPNDKGQRLVFELLKESGVFRTLAP